MNRRTLSERDMQLIHGLQIAPRASWVDAARILGSTPAAVAARWDRLRTAGIAWITAHPGARTPGTLIAFVEVDCLLGRKQAVVEHLCADPRVLTIEQSARGGDLLLTVTTPDLRELSGFVLDDLERVDGVQRHRTHLAKRLHHEARSWGLGSLDAEQRAAFAALNPPPEGTWTAPLPRDLEPLVEALARDGRTTAAEMARLTGRKPATVRRQMARLIGSGVLSFRCELAQGYSRWPVNCTYFARVPPRELERTVASLTTLPELRLCVSTTGQTNLMFGVWVGSTADLLDLEQRISGQLPWVQVLDSAVTLRTAKRMGWMLDELGAATGEVVVSSALRSL